MQGPAVFIDLSLEDQVNKKNLHLIQFRNENFKVKIILFFEGYVLLVNCEFYKKFVFYVKFVFILNEIVFFFRLKNFVNILKVLVLKSHLKNQQKVLKMIYIKSLVYVMYALKMVIQMKLMLF